MAVQAWVKEIVEEVCGTSPLEIGRRYQHPEHGVIIVTSGQYWGSRGISNFWYWTDAAGNEHHGYGGRWPEVKR